MTHPIAMLWMRGDLSFLEVLCIRSFLDAGHPVALYSYGEVGRVPEGVERSDAAEILSEEGFLVHARTGSPALHSDLFRYRLLERGDGTIWADTDAYCLRPFDPSDGHFHGWESAHHVNGGVLGLPPDSGTLAALLDFTRDEYAIPPWLDETGKAALEAAAEAGTPVHVGDQTWGVWGPHAITHFLRETGEIRHALPRAALYPWSFRDRRRMLRPDVDPAEAITGETRSIHLYGRRMRKRMAEVDLGLPHPQSLIGSLLAKHRVDPCEAPLRDCPEPDRDHPFARHYREAATGRRHHRAASVPAASPVRPLDRVVAITTMRNEAPYILDWVAYHLGVGITHFLVYTNDCDDQTEAILDRLSEMGLVTREDNAVEDGVRPQRQALARAGHHACLAAADAYVVMDVDEYINVHAGDGRLTDLFAAAGDPDLLSMTWRFFGSDGVAEFEDAPVPLRHHRAAPEKTRKPHHAWGFKTIVRLPMAYSEIGVHRPVGPTGGMPRWTNGSGRQMPEEYLEDGWRSNRNSWGYELVTLNHYAIRSLDSFLVKRERGRTNHVNRDQGIEYWNIHNRNDLEDRRILSRWPLAAGARAVFDADTVLARLHADACRWHRDRALALREAPENADLLAAIGGRLKDHDIEPTAEEAEPARPEAGPKTERAEPEGKRDPQVTMNSDRLDRPRNGFGDLILVGEENEHAFAALLERTSKRFPRLEGGGPTRSSGKIVVVTSMKNEGCFIVEWIAHHLSIGVTHFLVYTNDCDDPTNEVLDRLEALGHVTRVDNPFNRDAGQKPQRGALNDAIDHPIVKDADWVGVIDVDEFVNIHLPEPTLPNLFATLGDPNIVSMTWRFFGNGGVHGYEDRWIAHQFERCAPRYLPRPRLGWGFKSFAHRSAPYSKLGVHRPLDLDVSDRAAIRWVNGSGRVMPEKTVDNTAWFSRKASIGYDLVTLNHYVLRSAESFLVKRQRGRINHVDQDQGLTYWCERNYSTERDDSIRAMAPQVQVRFDGLMADGELRALHEAAVGWHRGRISALMAEDDYRALYEAITDPALPDAIWHRHAEMPLEAAE